MTKKVCNRNYSIPMGDIVPTMRRIMEHLATEIKNFNERLTPVVIQLDISDDLSHGDIHLMRIFLKGLRKIHREYFVRFATSVLWAAESDNTDIFYTKNDYMNRHADVVMKLRIFDKKHVMANVHFTKRTPRHTCLKNLSKTMLHEIVAHQEGETENEDFCILSSIAEFCLMTDVSEIIRHSGDDEFHLMFIPSTEGWSYFAVPLFGLSLDDARRRYLAAEKELSFLTTKHSMVIPEMMEQEKIIEALVECLQGQGDDGDRYATAQETYALAELLYGYHVANEYDGTKVAPKNEFLMFQILENEDKTTSMKVHSVIQNQPET